MTDVDVHDQVSEFYGKTVKRTEDLVFDACCVTDYDPALLDAIPDEVKDRRYGCGSPIPPALEGATVLDLGSGAGIDCFVAAQLVGPTGEVIGLDMTAEQLDVARRNVAPFMEKAGFAEPNVRFIEGKIESIPLEDNSVDVVMSNCVINLSPAKDRVFSEIRRVLKPGGEFYIADIVADRRIPERLRKDALLYSECLSGAAYAGDLRRIMHAAGFEDVRTVKSRRLNEVVDGIHFDSIVLRGFKLPLEDACEDYGQVAVYRGTLTTLPNAFVLNTGHNFPSGAAVRICKNTADMLLGGRYAAHFEVSAPMSHMGPFECGPSETSSDTSEELPAATGCC